MTLSMPALAGSTQSLSTIKDLFHLCRAQPFVILPGASQVA